MIVELYTFSPGSYVVADEWNANFNVIYKENGLQAEAISDAYDVLAFPNSDLTQVFNAVKARANSHYIDGNSVDVAVEQEYYKPLASAEALNITIPSGLDGEARILIQTQDDRTQLDELFTINYTGTKIINHYNNNVFRAGFYYIMIYESNGIAQAKLIWTGV